MRPWTGPFGTRGYHQGNLREALSQVAQRFIAERGMGGFSLADTAKLAGVSPTALYRHFRGRDELVAEVAGRGFDHLAERLARALRSPGTPIERFTRMGRPTLPSPRRSRGSMLRCWRPRQPPTRAAPGARCATTRTPVRAPSTSSSTHSC